MSALLSTPEPAEEPDESASMPNIPVGWKPTMREPIPVIRCIAMKRDGTRCKRWSLRGAQHCIVHGGQLPNVQDHAAAVVEAAKLRLMGMSDAAIDQIEDLMVNATGEGIRLKAAQDVLDRAGVKGAVEIDVTVTHEKSAAERVQERLAQISDRITKGTPEPTREPEPTFDDEDIVDVEIEEGDESGS